MSVISTSTSVPIAVGREALFVMCKDVKSSRMSGWVGGVCDKYFYQCSNSSRKGGIVRHV